MEVKFEIGTINNSEGKGNKRKFIRLQQEEPMTDDELASAIEHECTLSRADIKAVFEALRYHITNSRGATDPSGAAEGAAEGYGQEYLPPWHQLPARRQTDE